ncbi:MAG TPA: sulfatase [Chthoniobacteraceae bacterium]|nr:sulfatase [Chthoniobacteraceae bacterium]
MNRFLPLAAVLIASLARPLAAAPEVRPNILWLIAEDIGPDLGCYGDPDSRTPKLDRLAAQGRLYRNAYSTAPVCSPSRSAFCTGMYQTSFGAQHHRSHRDDGYQLPAGVRLVTDRLREAGYFTANVKALPPELGFSGAGKKDWNFTFDKNTAFDSDKWADLKTHQPFYAQLNFHETHRPYKKAQTNPTGPATVTLPPYLADHPVAREDWAMYHDAIDELDAKAGAVLDLLDREGLAENTIVFFFGDHGRECFRGKYFSYEQGCHDSLIVRWPGKLPAGTASGDLVSLIDVTATSLSLAGVKLPADFPGQPFVGPEARKREYLFTARDRIDDTLDRVRTVRDARFKYIRNFEPERPYLQPMAYAEHTNPNFNLMKELFAAGKLNADQAKFMAPRRPPEELYDLQNDPWEFHNLAASPEHAPALGRLRETLDRWMRETHDGGDIPEDPATLRRILEAHQREMERQFGNAAR